MDRLLDKKELAERLHVPEDTLSFWRARGRGPKGVKIGKRVLYKESEVERWLAERFEEAERD